MLCNPMNEAFQRPPATATRAFELTPYEKIVKYMLEIQRDFKTADPKVFKTKVIPASGKGGCSISTLVRFVDVFVPKSMFGSSNPKRRVILEMMIGDLIKNGFIETEQTEATLIYHLTDKYKTVDVNTLLQSNSDA